MVQVTSSDGPSAQNIQIQRQHTLAAAVEQSGISLHLGIETQVRILPAEVDTGRIFIRSDLPGKPSIPAAIASVYQTQLSTELGAAGATVRTVEHLLAALTGLGIDNAIIEVNGPELPLLDGSARGWVDILNGVERRIQSVPAHSISTITVQEPLWVRDGDAFVVAMPAAVPRLTYGIDFDLPAIGNQWHSWIPTEGSFATEIAPARTFGLAHQVEYLRSQGLIRGGSLDNALVCDRTGWLNPPLRFDNEPVRHKILDLMGDLSLLGRLPKAHIIAYKASHALHIELARAASCLVTSPNQF